MSFYTSCSKPLRENNFELLCHRLCLCQKEKVGGYELQGHCVIKSNDRGQIYADIVITQENIELPWGKVLPSKSYESSELFTLFATTLDGTTVEAKGLRIKTNNMYLNDEAKRFIVPLSSIEISEVDSASHLRKWKRSIRSEFREKIDIPVNVNNTVESSSGGRSLFWNETLIESDDYLLQLVNNEGYYTLVVYTNNKDIDKLYEIVLFYIGFMSGVIAQPYILRRADEFSTITSLRSLDRSQTTKSIPPPTTSHVRDQNRGNIDGLHYQLLQNLIEKHEEGTMPFDCLYNHWIRIWHSLQSKADTVPGITLTTSIEGVLNDLFIPDISKLAHDEFFEKEKARILEMIGQLDGLSKGHKESIEKFIGGWGSLHAGKAISILVERGLLLPEEKKAWSKLRNSLAHPRIKEGIGQDAKMMSDRVVMCLGVFYKLTLYYYNYKGFYIDYSSTTAGRVLQFPC